MLMMYSWLQRRQLRSIDEFGNALEWTVTLKIKPAKCRSRFKKGDESKFKRVLQSYYSCFNPLLKVKDTPIKCDDKSSMFKYLGRYVQYNLKEDLGIQQVTDKLAAWPVLEVE